MFLSKNSLSKFKKQRNYQKTSAPARIFFQISFDEYGAYIDAVDQNGKSKELAYQDYSGPTRQILRIMDRARQQNAFQISWEKDSGRVYLHEHDFILWHLKHCSNIIDADQKPISIQKGIHRVSIIIKEELPKSKSAKPYLKSRICLKRQPIKTEDLHVLNEAFLLYKNDLCEVQPLGDYAQELASFESELLPSELSTFLSLLYSYLPDVPIQYEDFQVLQSDTAIEASPCIVFDQIDEGKNLFLRVAFQLPNVPLEILEEYELINIAEVNELNKTITIKPFQQPSLTGLLKEVKKVVRRCAETAEERKFIYQEDNVFILPAAIGERFIKQELTKLLGSYSLYGADKLTNYKIQTQKPQLSLKLSHGIDFFGGDAELDFKGQKINVMDAIRQFKKQNYIKLDDKTHAIVNAEYMQKLERIFKKGKNGKVKVSFFDLPVVEQLLEERASQTAFPKSRDIYTGFNKLAKSRSRLPKIQATLRPYQQYGVRWLLYLYKHKLGGCLADDMGLGKTIQTITLLSAIYPKESMPSLIVMPRSLLYNWQSEIQKFSPDLNVYIYYQHTRSLEDAQEADVILTTYGMVRSDVEKFKEMPFFYVVLDESQNIKNFQSQTAKAVFLLQAKHRLALSGTPLENNLGELYSLFRFLNPSMFGSLASFQRNYATPIQKHNNNERIEELRLKIYPFILRRLKKEVLKDLPDKIEQTLYVEMPATQKKLYESRRAFYKELINTEIKSKGMQGARFSILQGLTELRQLATVPEAKTNGEIVSPKLELLEEYLTDIIANNRKALVFVNYLASIESVSDLLNRVGIQGVSMTGATNNRQELVDRFQNDPSCRVFLMTLKTGNLGLNLVAADTVFIYDPWWNLAAENQAVDRAYRIGQKSTVMSYKIITKGTIEEKIIKLQAKKKAIFDSIISSDSNALKSLSEEDIQFILT